MKSWKLSVFFTLLASLTLMTIAERRMVASQEVGYGVIEDVTNPYEVDPNWPEPLSQDFDWSTMGSVFAETPNRVYVCQTGQFPPSYATLPANDPQHPNWPSHRFKSSPGPVIRLMGTAAFGPKYRKKRQRLPPQVLPTRQIEPI